MAGPNRVQLRRNVVRGGRSSDVQRMNLGRKVMTQQQQMKIDSPRDFPPTLDQETRAGLNIDLLLACPITLGGAGSSVESPDCCVHVMVWLTSTSPSPSSSAVFLPLSFPPSRPSRPNSVTLLLFLFFSFPSAISFCIAKDRPSLFFLCRGLSGIPFCPPECETRWDVIRKDSRPCGAELEGA